MKSLAVATLAVLIGFGNVNQAKALDITTSVAVGVAVGAYAGAAAGVAASSLLVGTELILTSRKEAVAKAVLNDAQNYYLTGELSVGLENSIKGLQALDSSISEEEAIDLLIASVTE